MLPYMNDLLETLESKLAAASETWTTQAASRLNRQVCFFYGFVCLKDMDYIVIYC
jgi:hypothetical protein